MFSQTVSPKKFSRSDLPDILKGATIPRHIAVIMDGNGRWARFHRLSRIGGHRRGTESVRRMVTACSAIGVEALTLYSFSEQNWQRPPEEISALMRILKKFLVSERSFLQRHDVRLRAIGDLERLPKDVRGILDETIDVTRTHKGLWLVLALSYGGRNEILRAVRSIAGEVRDAQLDPQEITTDMISSHLDTAGLPDPDLLIRTSGEFRTSNFLPWQTIYSELYITPTLWPEFTPEHLYEAILDFSNRERRFGLTSEQLASQRAAR